VSVVTSVKLEGRRPMALRGKGTGNVGGPFGPRGPGKRSGRESAGPMRGKGGRGERNVEGSEEGKESVPSASGRGQREGKGLTAPGGRRRGRGGFGPGRAKGTVINL